MDNQTYESYTGIIIALICVVVIIFLATPLSNLMKNASANNLDQLQNKITVTLDNIKDEDFFGKIRDCTYYTQENLDNLGDRAVAVGYNNALYVVGLYSNDYSEVVLSKNTKSSNGLMVYETFMNDERLTSVIVRDGLLNVSNRAFKGCINLSEVYLSSSLEYIGYDAFNSTGIRTITIPASIKTIEQGAFANCPNLENITFLGKVVPTNFRAEDYPNITITYAE